ncbi:NAD-dependent epimerase/dehydratase family protein [Lacticaseibacillus mingshuiensis]|uniref:NAD-dependent epimerase/dehydratase family protein n=1 Tax=Lacticaseibacillus mingshuiensis TaxID=2799574 RepID=UPI0019524C0B|nr:NAD-dependent epimerase/dehydratase family protein [Lacticaseibacillus mingshuiensis]
MSKVFVLGGTGFLGYYTTKELLARGYQVKTMALPPVPADNLLPSEVELSLGNINELSDSAIEALLADCEGFVYAAGADERVVPDAPALSFFYEANVLPTQRIARLAARAGVKKFVVFGSYFAEFSERWADSMPRLKNEPYPNTRLLQEQVAFAEGEGKMTVSSLRLPYIFGTMPGRMPLWKMFVDQIRDQPVFPALPGGTAMVTVEQVAEAAVGALENGVHRGTYAIDALNMTYKDFYEMIVEALGQVGKTQIPVVTYEQVQAQYEAMDAAVAAQGKEHGIHIATTGQIQARELYLDPQDTMPVLGIRAHDVKAAIRESLEKAVRG